MLADHPWLAYLDGRNPSYPVEILRRDLDTLRRKVRAIRDDPSTPDTRLSDDILAREPVALDSLTELMLGGLPPGNARPVLHCRLRYFDPERRRPGLPPDVAALVERLTADAVTRHPGQSRSHPRPRRHAPGRGLRRAPPAVRRPGRPRGPARRRPCPRSGSPPAAGPPSASSPIATPGPRACGGPGIFADAGLAWPARSYLPPPPLRRPPMTRPSVSRRSFLQAGTAMATAASLALSSPPRRKTIAFLGTEVRTLSHAQHFLDRLAMGYTWDGGWHTPEIDIAGVYIDQFPKRDLARERVKKYGLTLYPTIREALTLGGRSLAVDGVVIIGEHGRYPRNEMRPDALPALRVLQGGRRGLRGERALRPRLQRQAPLDHLGPLRRDGRRLAAAEVPLPRRLVAPRHAATARDRPAPRHPAGGERLRRLRRRRQLRLPRPGDRPVHVGAPARRRGRHQERPGPARPLRVGPPLRSRDHPAAPRRRADAQPQPARRRGLPHRTRHLRVGPTPPCPTPSPISSSTATASARRSSSSPSGTSIMPG